MKSGRVQKSVVVFVCLGTLLTAALPVLGAASQESGTLTREQVPWSAVLGPKDSTEDLHSLLADPLKLHAQPPLLGASEKESDFTRELVRVQWRAGDAIDLWVIRPVGVEKPPVVLYLYSYPSETDRFRHEEYCKRVTRGGYAAVGFVSALTGHRYHGVPMKEWFVSDLPDVLVESAHDVQMILNYLSTRGDLDMNRVGMYGQGSGATIAVLAAAVDPRIKALNLLNPWGDWRHWLAESARVPDEERPKYVTRDFQKKLRPLDTVRWLPKLKSRAIRVQEVADDVITPADCRKRIESAARRASARIDRYGSTEELLVASTEGRAFQWIKEQFKPAPEQQVAAQ